MPSDDRCAACDVALDLQRYARCDVCRGALLHRLRASPPVHAAVHVERLHRGPLRPSRARRRDRPALRDRGVSRYAVMWSGSKDSALAHPSRRCARVVRRAGRAAGLEHVVPLWGEPPAALLAEFVAIGGRAVVTCVETAKLDASWLGRVIDERFVRDIAATGIDPCGENGEYHSFAYSGPFFASAVPWGAGERRDDGRFAQLDLV